MLKGVDGLDVHVRKDIADPFWHVEYILERDVVALLVAWLTYDFQLNGANTTDLTGVPSDTVRT